MCNFYVMYYVNGEKLLSNNICMTYGPPYWHFDKFAVNFLFRLILKISCLHFDFCFSQDLVTKLIHLKSQETSVKCQLINNKSFLTWATTTACMAVLIINKSLTNIKNIIIPNLHRWFYLIKNFKELCYFIVNESHSNNLSLSFFIFKYSLSVLIK